MEGLDEKEILPKKEVKAREDLRAKLQEQLLSSPPHRSNFQNWVLRFVLSGRLSKWPGSRGLVLAALEEAFKAEGCIESILLYRDFII